MSTKEVPRPGLFRALVTQKLTVAQVALALKLTIRQVRRLLARYRTGGAAALVHRSRGRPSKRRLPKEVRAKVLHLIQTTYQGLSDCHLTEKLTEVEGLSLCRESVRRLRESLKLAPQRRRRPPRHHQRRIPEARLGAMIQVDGSPFDWLQGRGPMMSLLGGVDDASSRFTGLIFRPHEDLHGYASVFHQTFTRYGLPGAFYGDRTGILHRNDAHWSLEEELQGSQFPTQLGSALHELGIGYIAAHSPQAKGRVENRWGTLQDRLTSELRLRDIDTLEGANLYLPEFSEDFDRRFAHPPREAPSAFPARSSWPCAAVTLDRWPATTPSPSPAAGCRSRPVHTSGPMPAQPLNCANCSAASSSCAKEAASWQFRRRHRVPSRWRRAASPRAHGTPRTKKLSRSPLQDPPGARIARSQDPSPRPATTPDRRRHPRTPGAKVCPRPGPDAPPPSRGDIFM